MRRGEPEKSRREEYSEATREALLSAARAIFATEGYQATGIEAIARAARVTRGAFYHHFTDKKALFDTVVVSLQAEAARLVELRARPERELWARLEVGIDAYLAACLDPAYRRLVIQEAPAVLGAARYREIDEAYPLGLLTASLKALKRSGELEVEDAELFSRMVGAMICEVALLQPDAAEPAKLKKRAQAIVGRILAAFRRR